MDWIDQCYEINGNGVRFEGTKRQARYLNRKYPEVMEDVVVNYHRAAKKMESHKIAAMFKAGGVTGKNNRRGMLRVLRDHFGKQAFVSKASVGMLCDGHSDVNVGSIQYQYEDGAIPETIEYMEKSLAMEVAAQMAVSFKTVYLLLCNCCILYLLSLCCLFYIYIYFTSTFNTASSTKSKHSAI